MPTALKVFLIVVATLVLVVGGAGWAGYNWYQSHGKEYLEAMKTAGADGRTFALTGDNAACVKSAVDRYGQDSTFKGTMQGSSFLSGCLEKSTRTPGFCDDVPVMTDRPAAREWARKQCSVAAAPSRNCPGMLNVVEGFCHPRSIHRDS